jgi:hypothetical protein
MIANYIDELIMIGVGLWMTAVGLRLPPVTDPNPDRSADLAGESRKALQMDGTVVDGDRNCARHRLAVLIRSSLANVHRRPLSTCADRIPLANR